ncbi:MAG TPA: GNAT family N-acetyltransferase [Chthoniobacteraceae bacterium]|jgi:predicted N-acetyltransferase YhbS|nr:GNAT family N-acetyltransferase [Chthoniobacteraceae bacterium]
MAESPGTFIIMHRLDEEIFSAEDEELRQLLLSSFPYETALLSRRYIRKAPAHRWLVRAVSGELVAHVGVHDLVIGIGTREVRIGGIAEVCVAHSHRGRGLVGKMLAEAHAWMEREGIPFAMLFGHPKIYTSIGYQLIENPIQVENALIHTWNPFKGKPMVRLIGAEPWPTEPVDLRGPTF